MIKERPKFNWLHLLIFIVVVEASAVYQPG